MIINITGTGKPHYGINKFRHGKTNYGTAYSYDIADEVLKFHKIYVLSEEINADKAKYKYLQPRADRKKALVVSDGDTGCRKQRNVDIAGVQASAPQYNFTTSADLALYEAVNDGATEITLYRFSLDAGTPSLLHNVLWAENKGVKITWAWRKYIETQVQAKAPDKPKKKRTTRKRKSKKSEE